MRRLGSLLSTAALLVTMAVAGAPSHAATNRLNAGQQLQGDATLVSRNGQHHLVVGSVAFDEGLTIMGQSCDYRVLVNDAEGTNVLRMQGDGNLVLYTAGRAKWSTRTQGNRGAYAVLQDDRNLVVYSASNRALWSSRTVCNVQYTLDPFIGDPQLLTMRAGHYMQSADRRYRLAMQGDGNLVLYGPSGRATWSSRTAGNHGARFVMQPDNNLVVYSAGGRALWNSRTSTGSGFQSEISGLHLQSDGNLVLYKITGWDKISGVRWQTRTSGAR